MYVLSLYGSCVSVAQQQRSMRIKMARVVLGGIGEESAVAARRSSGELAHRLASVIASGATNVGREESIEAIRPGR